MKKNNLFYTIQHHGGRDGVTGSCHELRVNSGAGILVDCGLFQGAEVSEDKSSFEQLQITFPVEHIKALIVTHVHIDHVGRIPYLLAAGFQGPIICSEASAKLLPLVLEDAVKIGFTRDTKLVEKFIQKIKSQIVPLRYRRWLSVIESSDKGVALKVKLKPAGHILGSSYVECIVNGDGQKERIVFSGDLGPPHTPLLPAPKSPYRADLLVLESTYGDRLHAPRNNRVVRLKQAVERALRNRGVVLIPTFSIGRTQELLYELEQIIHQYGKRWVGDGVRWCDLEVIVDSPLAAKFTRAYRELRPFWDREAKGKLRRGRHPLSFEQLLTIDDHQTHLQTVDYLAKNARPTVVLAASGMCSGGRVVNYLKALIQDERHDILFVGYQAQGTPGRDILKYGPDNGYVELDGQRYTINAGVEAIAGYSAHADQKDLVNFVKRMRVKPREIRLVHGDAEVKQVLQRELRQYFPRCSVST
ncbi:MAG: MBL fold metallo-hydrolase [Gammaproteobacteria bacterium]|nr:MBL fold metallo-hydrolase [Gammaproteobacteria bacterium]